MGYEVIPFHTFMSITPKASILSAVDGGLTFFLGIGTTLLVLIVLEKMGVKVNESLVRFVMYGGVGFGFVMLCLKTYFFFG